MIEELNYSNGLAIYAQSYQINKKNTTNGLCICNQVKAQQSTTKESI